MVNSNRGKNICCFEQLVLYFFSLLLMKIIAMINHCCRCSSNILNIKNNHNNHNNEFNSDENLVFKKRRIQLDMES